MNKLRLTVAAAALALGATPAILSAQQQMTEQQAQAIAKSLRPQHGKIVLPEANASLNLGEAYDFYGPADAKQILTSLWGNPAQMSADVLGLVIPAGKSPLSDTWGAVITFDKSGYVSDDDAAEVDFNELLGQMRESEAASNPERKAQGFPETHLVGWAEQPRYDKASHSVIWARDVKFSNMSVDTLNYDVRTLGRHGVLSVNLVSTMPQLAGVKAAAATFAGHAAFNPGSRYEDFDASMDKKAEYGIGGLIAAGVGVAAAKKLGLLAILLKFLKPIAIGVVAAIAVLRKKIASLFGGGHDPLEG